MALPDLTGQNIENTYQRVIQTDGTNFYDGTGSLVNFGGAVFPYTGSAIISGSLIVTGSTEIQYLTASGLNYPDTDGTEFMVLRTDGSGNLSFDYSDRTSIEVRTIEAVTKGDPLRVVGFNNGQNRAEVRRADALNPSLMPSYGLAYETVGANVNTQMVALGALDNVNTQIAPNDFQEGDILYVQVGGGLTNVKPTGSALIQNVGKVARRQQNSGEILVSAIGRSNDIPNIQPGYAWIGNENWVATAVPTSSFNEDPFPYTGSAAISGALEVTGDVTIYGTASVNVLVTNYESSSIIYSSGSTKFGDSLDDTHIFTGSVSVTGSLDVIGDTNITGSLTTSGSIVDFSLASSINLGLQPSFKSTGLFLVDTTVNYNVTTAIAVQFNQIEYNQGNSLTPETGSATKITVSEAGYYQVDALVAFNVGGQRTTPGMNVYVDGVEVEGRAYGYIRNASGADEASCTISRVIYLPNGNEQVEIRVANYATSATCNAQQGYFQLTKVDNPALQGPVGPVGPAGQAGTSFSVSLESTGRTLALSDNLTYIKCSPSSPGATYTVPPQSDVSWPDSCEVAFEQGNAFPITIAAGSGVTVNSSATLVTSGQNAVIALKRVNTDTWTLTGERATT